MNISLTYGQQEGIAGDLINPVVPIPGQGFFRAFTTSAVTLTTAAAGSVPVLFNPANSNVNIHIFAVKIGLAAVATTIGALLYGIGVGLTFATTTPGPTIIPGNLSAQNPAALPGNIAWFTTATASAAPGTLFPSGFSLFTGATTAQITPGPLDDLLLGSIIIAPGNSFFPLLASANTAATAIVSVEFYTTAVGK